LHQLLLSFLLIFHSSELKHKRKICYFICWYTRGVIIKPKATPVRSCFLRVPKWVIIAVCPINCRWYHGCSCQRRNAVACFPEHGRHCGM
jgi:hypothetical protein